VRNYGTYGRADVVGLKAAGGYELKVVPVVGGSEDQSKASTVSNLTVMAYDRSGFAHHNNSGVGAYNDDGTLKQNACVIYVTAQTAKTITMDVAKNNKGETTTYTGLQNIINGYQKGYEIIMTPEAQENTYIAGAVLCDGKLVTSGGRVAGTTAVADSLSEAIKEAYRLADGVQFEKMIK